MAGGYDGEIRIRTLIENGKASSQLLQLEAKFQKLISEAKKLTDGMREIEKMKVPTEEYKNLQNQFDALVVKGKKLSETLKGTEKYVPTEEYLQVQKQLEQAEAKLNKLKDAKERFFATGGKEKSTAFQKMQYDINLLERSIPFIKGELQDIESSGKDRRISDKWQEIKNQMAQAGTEASKVKAQMRDMEASGTANIDPKSTAEYQKKAEKLQEVNRQLGVTKKKMEEVAAKEAKVGSGSKQIEKVGNAAKKSAELMSTFLSRLKGITLSLFIFNWITKGFNAMVSAFKDGIQNMAKYSTDFNSRMSELKSATATLKASLGTLAAPILSAIIPAIVKLCGWLTNAVNAVNKFISAISGKKTWTRAKKQQIDYASSLDKTAKAAKKVKGALQGFDELNVISSNDSDGSSGTGNSAGNGYEEVPLTEKDLAWVEKIKKLFEAILPIVTAIGAALLTWKLTSFLTDLMKTHPILGTILSILSVIAGVVLAVVSYFHMWENGVDWKGIIGYITGTALAFAGLYALFGQFAAGIALVVAGIAGFVLALKDMYTNGVNVKNVTLMLVSIIAVLAGTFFAFGATVATAVGGVLGVVMAILSFVQMLQEGFSWLNEIIMIVGIAIAAVAAVILGVPAAVAAAVAAIVAVVLTLVVLIKEHWSEICDWFSGAADWFNENVVTPIVDFFKGLWEKVSGFFQNLWNDISGIWQTVSGWFSTYVIEPIVGFFQGLWTRVQQIFEGLWIIVQAVWIIASGWFNDNVITPIVTFFQGLWEKVSGFFSKLWDDIKKIWDKVSKWFDENVIIPVVGFFGGMKESVFGFFSKLWDDIKGIWTKVSGWFNDNVISPLSQAFTKLWDGLKSGVVGAMNAVIGGIESGINFIVGGINNILGGFNKVVSWAAKVAEVDWGGVDLVPKVTLPRVALANGGITTGSTIAQIGEAGREAVLPLENNLSYLEPLANMIASKMEGVQTVRIVAEESGIFKIVRDEANSYYRRTGNPAFDF